MTESTSPDPPQEQPPNASAGGDITRMDQIDSTAMLVAMEQERERIGRFNLAIVGGTGVGKSSLVNAVFEEPRAETGVGLPVTAGVSYYQSETGSLGVWDFEGFEIGTDQSPGEMLAENLRTIAAGPKIQQIAVVWYCVASTAARLTTADIANIRAFHESGLQVILVLTKVARVKHPVSQRWTYSEDAVTFSEWLSKPTDRDGNVIEIPVEAVMLTAAVDQGRFGGEPHGLLELLDTTLALSPDGAEDALRIAQRLSLGLKLDLARKYILAAAAAAGGAAAQPFPIADAALLAPIQLGMMGRLTVVYELDSKGVLGAQFLAPLALKFAGKAAARSLVKLIPGVGSVINGAVAITLTAASGEGWRRFCEAARKGEVDLSQAESVWKDYGPTALEVINIFLRTKARGATAKS